MANTEVCYLAEVGDLDLYKAPQNLEEAKEMMDWPKLEGVVNEEMKMLTKMETWEEEPLEVPPRKSVIDCHFVFAIKRNEKGNVIKYKARLVARGFIQMYGIDYPETFVPVIQMDSI